VEKMDRTYIIPVFIWLAEMFFLSEEIPAKVSINEAVELAKIYWTETAPKMVNWVLDRVYKDYDNIKEEIKNIEKTTFSFFQKND
jgi:hypothetical protein